MKPLEIETYLRGRRVLVTGHTGFTGSWLLAWLGQLECKIAGLSLAPATEPSLFVESGSEKLLTLHRIGNINDRAAVQEVFDTFDPEIVFHLAAQPIVSVGYSDPHMTFETNVMGTLNVLESARTSRSTKAVVCVTTDKVYDNREWVWGYREIDPLGGKDPYSASKSACEMVVKTYQQALSERGNGVRIAAARGGNIIGGGDWAENRIVPDFVRASAGNRRLELRNPAATRPWQHVLALVHGYIQLGAALFAAREGADSAWNFGPTADGEKPVQVLIDHLLETWPGTEIVVGDVPFKESHFLSLSSEKAQKELGWHPGLDFAETVRWTADWYRAFYDGQAAADLTIAQVTTYRNNLENQF